MQNRIDIESLADGRLDRYRDLKSARLSRKDDCFIAEGRWVVERLLESRFEVESVLLTPKWVPGFIDKVSDQTELLVVSQDRYEELVGFRFHRGVMACAIRERRRHVELPEAISNRASLLCVFPDTTLDTNLGGMIRSCAAFGVDGVVVGRQSADPFSRRTIRSSMGTVFRMSVFQPDDLEGEIGRLVGDVGFEVVTVTSSSEADSLDDFSFPGKTVLVFGNEAEGVSERWRAKSVHSIGITMVAGVDSLNVGAAAAIILHEWSRTIGR